MNTLLILAAFVIVMIMICYIIMTFTGKPSLKYRLSHESVLEIRNRLEKEKFIKVYDTFGVVHHIIGAGEKGVSCTSYSPRLLLTADECHFLFVNEIDIIKTVCYKE